MMKHLSKLFISSLFLSILPSVIYAEQQNTCSSQSIEKGFVDQAYHYLNSKFCQPAVWFDDFFVDSRADNDARAGTVVRWYNDFSRSEFSDYKYKSKLSARVHLPKVTKKLKLIFESDEDDPPQAFLEQDNSEETKGTLGLRYDIYAKQRSSFNIKVTLRPSIAGRYRYTYAFTKQTSSNFTQQLYQKKNITGESSQFDLEHSFTPEFLLRWTDYIRIETESSGFTIGSGLTLYQFISSKKAISYKASINGHNKPYHYINNTHLSITYRQNILRKWFFYEVTPEINWDKEFTGERIKEATITLRLEVLFDNV